MKVLIADKFPDDRMEQLKAANFEVEYQPTYTEDNLPDKISDFQALVVRSTKVTKEVLEAAQALKVVVRAGAGTNTIDKDVASQKKISVCNTPGKNSVAVAELAMGLMLSLDRRIPDNVAQLKSGAWNKQEFSKAEGIKGKTLGLIGLGAIGKEVAKRALAFDMNVLAVDPFITQEQASTIGVTLADPDELIQNSDVISLHAPAIEDTKGMVNGEFLGKMKPGAMLINCARADLVDHQALMEAIETKGIRYGVDVPPQEPKDKVGSYSHEMFTSDNVYGTHHIGASTNQAQDAVAEEVITILMKLRDDNQIINQVNSF